MDTDAYNKARAAIIDHSAGRKGVKNSIPCDVCKKGRLFYQVHHNGHIWAQCNTPGCLAWME